MKAFKKYKSIIISVVIFILLDISVLVFNFYISFQISEDAAKINLAGRQRTLSQRITKNLLEFERSYNKLRDYSVIVMDIKNSMGLFDTTLRAFDQGGDVVIDDRIVTVTPVFDAEGRAAIEAAKPMWVIYKNYTANVLDEFVGREYIDENLVTIFFRESIVKDVVDYTTRNNLALLEVMNDLTEAVERVAFEKTQKLRMAQGFAISLAVINFFFILFFALRDLKKSDDELSSAKAEIDVMLDTISEGIFLLNPDLTISNEYSKEMEILFNRKDFSGMPILFLLKSVCPQINHAGVENFLLTLFDESKKANVLNVLNPLQEVLVYVDGVDSDSREKYLRFSYARIENNGRINQVLVRVCDISSEVLQQKVLYEERNKQFKHLRLISALMNSNADMLPMFFQRGFYCFDHIREELSSGKEKNLNSIKEMEEMLGEFRREAKRLALTNIVELVDEFEFSWRKIKGSKESSFSVCAEALAALDKLETYMRSMYELSSQVLHKQQFEEDARDEKYLSGLTSWLHLSEFANEVALEYNKEVEVVTSGLNDYVVDKKVLRILNSVILQIFYHSVTLSIEVPERRHFLKKSRLGLLDVRWVKKSNGGYYLTIRNDGAGIDVSEIKAVAKVHSGYYDDGSRRINKKNLLSLLLSSCNPEKDRPLSYQGDLLYGEELLQLIDKNNITFDARSVADEGSVFEFVFPSSQETI